MQTFASVKSFYTLTVHLTSLTLILISSWNTQFGIFFFFGKEMSKNTQSSMAPNVYFCSKILSLFRLSAKYSNNWLYPKRIDSNIMTFLPQTIPANFGGQGQSSRCSVHFRYLIHGGKNLEIILIEDIVKSNRQCQFIIIILPVFLFLILYFALPVIINPKVSKP